MAVVPAVLVLRPLPVLLPRDGTGHLRLQRHAMSLPVKVAAVVGLAVLGYFTFRRWQA